MWTSDPGSRRIVVVQAGLDSQTPTSILSPSIIRTFQEEAISSAHDGTLGVAQYLMVAVTKALITSKIDAMKATSSRPKDSFGSGYRSVPPLYTTLCGSE